MLPPLREPALAGGPARPDGSAVLGQDSPGPRDRPERQAMQLEGIRVVDLTRIIAGPFCSMFLADMGVKVETPGEGDPVRAQGAARNGCSLYFATFNRNKRSITLDLRTDDGREVLRRLLARSDVVVNNYRPGVMDRMGFGREALRAIKPDIVSCNVTGFGLDGPYADRPSFDFIAQAMSGFMSVNGDPTGPGMRAAPPTSTASRRCATPLPRPSTRPRRTPRPAARSRAC
jgi:crotonobetainyl-CoA:carnitine CoA-transferase CaiB-like acyl-CoA transferase